MPLPGGASDKYGLRYELSWTVLCLTDVLNGGARRIRLEPPGDEGEGIEFWVETDSGFEFHQVKRQRTGQGYWSLSTLDSEGILTNFFDRLSDPTASCVFASTHAAHPLDELSDRARRAKSWEEFRDVFLASQEVSGNFAKLHGIWNHPDQEESFDRLKRIWVRTISEELLRTLALSRLEMLVEGDPASVFDSLNQFVLGATHGELTADDIWNFLTARGYDSRNWGTDQTVIQAVEEQNLTYFSLIRLANIGGQVVPRIEVDQVCEILDSESDKNSVLLSGEAGTGKTLIIPQVVDRFANQGCPVLAVRVDRLLPTFQPTELGIQLGLPGSPVSVLASIANGGKCLLIIDQLDAVSLASARNPEFFDCIGAILDQARNYPEMRILLACRKFDLTHDPRFRRLIDSQGTATEVPVGLFDNDTVRGLVSGLGLDSSRLTLNQVELLALPFHLSLLGEITAGGTVDGLDFQTTKDLYDRFWNLKQTKLRARLDGATRYLEAIDILAQHMSEIQILFAPESILDKFGDEASVMASEGVLVLENSKFSFFHESFFDYVFARSLETNGFNLLEMLLKDEQHLFRRAQIRQLLIHQRQGDWNRYIKNTKGILLRNDIRFHLKKTVFALLAFMKDPQGEEWEVLEDLINPINLISKIKNRALYYSYQIGIKFFPRNLSNRCHFRAKIINTKFAEQVSDEVWMSIRGSVRWFDFLDSSGVLHEWLNDNSEDRIDRAVWSFRSIQLERADRVAELLMPFIGVSEQWNNRILTLISWSSIGASRSFFEFVLIALDKGILDALRGPIAVNGDFWDMVRPLSKDRPDWAAEITGHYCDRRLDRIIEVGHKNPFQDNGEVESLNKEGESVILESAQGDPKAFVRHVLPFMTRAIEINANLSSGPPWQDPIWSSRIYGINFGVDNSLLAAMENSLRTLAVEDPTELRSIAEELDQSEFETVQYLLIRAYAANGSEFADAAIEYLLKDPVKFAFGYLSDARWATAAVIAASTPHCTEDNLQLLEAAVISYYHPYERSKNGRRSYGHSQWQLLNAIDYLRLSGSSKIRLGELNRKFGDAAGAEPTGLMGGAVPSPIPDDAALKMTDDQWIEAISRYDSDDSKDSSDWLLMGGANQLARVLESQTRSDPNRIAPIALRIPDDANPTYLESVLRGIAGSALSPEKVVEICQHCHNIPNRPYGRWITDPLAKIKDSEISTAALELVAWYATEDIDPSSLQSSDEDRDPLTLGINSARGRAAESMGHLIFADSTRIEYFQPYIEKMVQDSSIAVRSCVALTLQGILRHDRELAVGFFIKLCDADDILLATHHVEMFLKYSTPTHYPILAPVLTKMIKSKDSQVAATGARQVCLASLTVESAIPLARRCVSGQKPLRLGAAEIFATNLKNSSHRPACEESLTKLFSDSNEEVRQAAAMGFNGIEYSGLGEYRALLRKFIKSPSFSARHSLLFRVLEDSTAEISEEILLACERFLDVAGVEAGDIRTSSAANSDSVTKLVLRVYSRTSSTDLRSRCLDLIDRMTAFNVYGLANAIEPLER